MRPNWLQKMWAPRRPIRKTAYWLRPLGVELLEDRTLPSGLPANVFALFSGRLAAGESHDTVRIHVLPENFTLPDGPVTLGFEVTTPTGSALAPTAVVVRKADGGNVSTLLQRAGDIGGTSLTLAKLGLDDYDLTVDGVGSSTGTWQLRVFLPGDVNGNLVVSQSDINLLQGAIQGTVTLTPDQFAAGDANRDGLITNYDLNRAQNNRGASTSIRILSVTTGLNPASETGLPNDRIVNHSPVSVVGHATPGVQIKLDRDGDGFDDGTTTASSANGTNYSFTTPLCSGSNTLRVRARDSFGQRDTTSVQITFDPVDPVVRVTAPDPGLITNANVEVHGRVTDALSGVSLLQARVDDGSWFTVAFNAHGRFNFTTALPLNGSADGLHRVRVRATDVAGNVSAVTVHKFTLDTQAPTATAPTGNFSNTFATIDVAYNERMARSAYRRVNYTLARIGGEGVPIASVSHLAGSPTARLFLTAPLPNGSYTLTIGSAVTDRAGNGVAAPVMFTFTIGATQTAPVIAATLAHDTAPSDETNADGITSDPTVSGVVTSASTLTSVRAGLDATPDGSFFDITSDVAPDGTFTLSRTRLEQILGGPLADGTRVLHLVATNAAGLTSPVYDLPFTLDTAVPTNSITGPTPGLLTNQNVIVSGLSADVLSGVAVLQQQTDSGAFVDVPFDPDTGEYQFATDFPLDGTVDGMHTVVVRAIDEAGNVSAPSSVTFRLDTTAPATPVFDLSVTSDTGTVGDHQTAASRVLLVGHTESLAVVTLLETGAATVANSVGDFQFADVDLDLDDNVFTVRAVDAAGNASTFTITVTKVTATTTGDAVLDWNQFALDAIRLDASAPPVATRNLAMVSAAVYDALSAIDGTPGLYVRLPAAVGTSAEAAAAVAAHRVLSYLYPGQAAMFDAALAASLGPISNGPGKDGGVALGRAVADATIALRANDGWDTFIDFVPPTGPGQWQFTPPMYAVALLPQWGDLRPFLMSNVSQFLPSGPPALTSQQWADAYNEVRSLGRATGSTRTADQTQVARFWADGLGTETPPGHWNLIASQVARASGNSLAANARLFAQLNLAMADAAIVAWKAKYATNFWRPVTAIRAGDTDGNDGTVADASWTSLLITPNFPDYVSGHSTFSGAAEAVLTAFFGDGVGFTIGSPSLPGVQRTFANFRAAAEEAGRSRIYGGIHYEFSNQDGLTAGRAIGANAVEAFRTTTDTRAPNVSVTPPAPVTATNVTLTGRVLDNLTGVQRLEVQVDDGAFTTVTFDAAGNFSLTTAFALDGSAEGAHALRFRATDFAGNVSDPVEVSLTLDTLNPTLTITAPTNMGYIEPGARLTGTLSGTGSAITSFSYWIVGGPIVPITPSDNFDVPLDLSWLTPGGYSMMVMATDAAGNGVTRIVNFTILTAIPLTVTEVTPAGGADEVGVTFRPKVVFSRPIDVATLTADNFYLSDTTGTRLPAAIVPASDGTFAWLFVQGAMPGASTITLTVDGLSIRALDGSLLDAAGTGLAGSTRRTRFTTVSTAGIPNTSLSGIVADPGPDLKPMTFDDLRVGPDGVLMTADDVYLNPIVHAKVYILGLESQFVYTDAQGRFTLPSVPSGNVKLAVDGRTSANALSGYFFPEMVMDITIEPGRANTVMGSMGPRETQAAMDAFAGVYLPRLQTSILHDVDPNTVTTIGVTAESAPNLTPEQRQYLTIEIQPGSLIGPDGQTLASGQVGISTVPPEMVRDMLPPGLLQHAFDITVQAPGITNFSTPAPMTFPNWANELPGTKLNFFSFNHTTGRMELEGTATVSPDGQRVTTDPGYGITHPGWHFVVRGANNDDLAIDNNGDKDYALAHLDPIADPFTFLRVTALSDALKIAVATGVFPLIARPFFNLAGPIPLTVSQVERYIYKLGDKDFGPGTAPWNRMEAHPSHLLNIRTVKEYVTSQIRSGNASETIIVPPSLIIRNIGFGTRDDLFGTINETQGARVDGELNYVNGGYEGTLTFKYFDTWGWENIPSEHLMYELQYYGLAKPFTTTISGLTVDIRVDAPQQPFMSLGVFGPEGSDVDSPSLSSESGFGSSPNVYFRFVTESGAVITGKTDSTGGINGVVFTPNTEYVATFYKPSTNRWTTHYGMSSSSGSVFGLRGLPGHLNLGEFGGADADGDGIPDIGEEAIGTDPSRPDTDGDGISDSAEITQDLDPLDGRAFATGVVANLPLQGQPQEVVVQGSTLDSQSQIAYVATGIFGLAIVNASQFQKPIVLGQLDLPGNAVDVAVDPRLGLAAVATGSGGLQIVDVTDPTSPRLLRTLNVGATLVEVVNGMAYATVGTTLQAFDILTGEVRQSLLLPGSTLTALAREGTMLYTLDSNKRFQVVDTSGFFMVTRGTLTLPTGGGKLFVGNGIAYVGSTDTGQGGFATVNVNNPDSLVLLSGSDAPFTSAPGTAMVTNGSGLGLLIGQSQRLLGTPSSLQLLNVTDPTNTYNFLFQVPLSAPPTSIAVASGIAFVTGPGGLQVINYLPFDNLGQSPTVTINTTALDIDPVTPGLQVVEGTTLPIRATISDDVQVRNVELLVNGQVVANDVSFPFDFSVIAPAITPDSNTVTIQVRVTDTGGNTTLSEALTLTLVPDTIAPVIVSMDPTEGSIRGHNQRTMRIRFSEALADATVSNATFRLLDGHGNQLLPQDIGLRNNGQLVQLTVDALPSDNYQLVIDAPNVTDRGGNALGTADVVTHFTVGPYSILWTNPAGGDWNNPANWDLGRLPNATDDVLIDVPNSDAVITHTGGSTNIRSLVTNETFSLSGGTFSIATGSSVKTLTQSGGTLAGMGTLAVSNLFDWANGTLGGSVAVVLGSSATAMIRVGGTHTFAGGQIDNTVGTIDWQGGNITSTAGNAFHNYGLLTSTGSGSGTFLGGGRLDNAGTFIRSGGNDWYFESGAVFTNLPGATIDFRNNGRVYWSFGSIPSFINQGTLKRSAGTGTLEFANGLTFVNQGIVQGQSGTLLFAGFTNSGAVQAQAGTISLSGGGTHTGTFDASAGAVIAFSGGSHSLQAGTAFTGAGFPRVTGGTTTLAVPLSVGNFGLDGGTLTGTNTLSVSGSYDWAGGTLGGTVSVTLGSSAVAVIRNGTHTFAGGQIDNTVGTIDWQGGNITSTAGNAFHNYGLLTSTGSGSGTFLGGGRLDNAGTFIRSGGNDWYFESGAVFTNLPGATIDFRNNGRVYWSFGSIPSFVNQGTLKRSAGTGTLEFANGLPFSNSGTVQGQSGTLLFAGFSNSGTVQAQAGTISLSGGGTHTGTFDAAAGAVIAFSGGSHSLQAGTAFTGAGFPRVTGGTTTLAVPLSVGNFGLDGGTLTGTNTLSVSGSYDWAGGTLGGSVSVTLGSSAVAVIRNGTHTFAGGQIDNTVGTIDWQNGNITSTAGNAFHNYGLLTSTGSGSGTFLGGGRLDNAGTFIRSGANDWYFESGAVFTNLPGATIDFRNNGRVYWSFGSIPSFVNQGTLKRSAGTGTLEFANGLPFSNSGTVQVQTGTVNFSGGGTDTGSFDVSSGATLAFTGGSRTLQTGVTFTGAGYSFVGTTLNVAGAVSATNFGQDGGTLSGAGTLTVSNSFDWVSGTLGGTVSVTLGSSAVAVIRNGTHTFAGGRIDNTVGTVDWQSGSVATTTGNVFHNYGLMTISGSGNNTVLLTGAAMENAGTVRRTGTNDWYFQGGAVFTNLPGALFDAVTNSRVYRDTSAVAVFDNQGTVRRSAGTGILEFANGLTFTNSGSVQVQTGTVNFSGGGTDTGSFDVSSGATLAFTGGSRTLQTGVTFTGAGYSFVGTTLNVAGAVSATNFGQDGGTLSGAGTLTVSNSFDWVSGTLGGTVSVTLGSSAVAVIRNGTHTFAGGRIDNTVGTVDWQSGSVATTTGNVFHNYGLMTISGSGNNTVLLTGAAMENAGTVRRTGTNDWYFQGGAVFTNLPGALFDAVTNSRVYRDTSAVAVFDNQGTVRRSAGTGILEFANGLTFTNSGSVQVQTGTVNFSGGGTDTGSFDVSSGATLAFTGGSRTLQTGVTFTGAGYSFVGTTLNVAGAVSATNFGQDGGTLSGAGTLTVSNSFDWVSGTLGGTVSVTLGSSAVAVIRNGTHTFAGGRIDNTVGTVDWQSGSVATTTGNVFHNYGLMTISGSGNNTVLLTGAAMENAGTVRRTGTNDWYFQGGAVFTNLPGALFDAVTNSRVYRDTSAVAVFDNQGTVRRSAGTGILEFANGLTFTNSGSVQVQTGTVQFSAGLTQTSGSIVLSGGSIGGGLIDIQGGSLSGSGIVSASVRNGGVVSPGGSGVAGRLTISGNYTQLATGVLNIELGGVTAGSQYDQLVVNGSATLDGTLNITLIYGFTPSVGNAFSTLTFATRTGTFATINGLDLGSSLFLTPTYNTTNFILTVI